MGKDCTDPKEFINILVLKASKAGNSVRQVFSERGI
jgi:hypothetical protein